MSKYKMIVIKYDENSKYEQELAKFNEMKSSYKNYGYGPDFERKVIAEPSLENAERSLEVFLTEAEFKKVKAEVIKTFE